MGWIKIITVILLTPI